MLIETIELNLSHAGLGALDEFTLMTLFANTLSHRIVAGKGIAPTQIADQSGQTLYPAYYATHLSVPPGHLLRRYRLWDEVSIGVDVQRFGGMLLDATHILGRPGEIGDDPRAWDLAALPAMRGGVMFVVDSPEGEAQVSAPCAELMADMPRLTAPPAARERFREVRVQASPFKLDGCLKPRRPILYPIVAGRDAAAGPQRVYAGHSMVFAGFVRIMDYAERTLLAKHVWPPFPRALLDCRAVLEREIYYFSTCHADQVVQVSLSGQLDPCAADLHGASPDIVSAGILTFALELYERDSNRLLVASRAKELLAVPTVQQSILRDAERLLSFFGARA